MKQFNKPTNKKLTDLSIESRLKAYDRCLEISRENLRSIEIWKKLKEEGIDIGYETIRVWTKGKKRPSGRLNIMKKSDEKLPYIIGIVIGDGCFYKVIKNGSYVQGRVVLGVKDKELAEYFANISSKIFEKKKKYKVRWSKQQNVYVVEFCSKELVELLSKPLPELDSIIKICPINFLKGIFDAEGCISIKTQNKRLYPRLFLTNSNLELISYIKNLLENYSIKSTIQKNTLPGKIKIINNRKTATRKICYNLCIENIKGVKKFSEIIDFTIIRKQEKLKKVVSLIDKYGTQRALEMWH